MEKLTVPKLKKLLKQRGLPCSGLKAELVKRLLEAEGSGEMEGAGAGGGETEGGASEDRRKRKAEVLGRGGKRKSKPTHGFISEESDDNEENPMSAGEEAGGEEPVEMKYKEEAAGEKDSREKAGENDSREKAGEKDSREKTGEEDSRQKTGEEDSGEKTGEKDSGEKTGEKDSRDKTGEEDSRKIKYFENIRDDGWYLKSLDRYKHSDRSTEDLAAEGLNNFKAFKGTLDTELTRSNTYSKMTHLRESLAESARFYMAVIESAIKVNKADQFLTAGRNVIACLSHLVNYVGVKEAFDVALVAAKTVSMVCREVPEGLLQGPGQAGRRGLLEVWTSLAVNLVEQAGQLQTKEVVSRLEQVQMLKS